MRVPSWLDYLFYVSYHARTVEKTLTTLEIHSEENRILSELNRMAGTQNHL